MKKFLGAILAVVIAVSCMAMVASAADVSVNLDGETLNFEQPPVIIEGRTLVPLRAIFEALGASVEWDGDTKTVTSAKDDVTVKLTIGSNILYKNDTGVELDVPAQIVGEGYTMVPARAIAEAYGVTVDWDDATKTVILTSPAPAVEEKAEEVEGAFINLLVADNYTADDKFYVSSATSKTLVVVDNPTQEGDKVFFLESNVTDKDAWTYFWAKPANNYVPGGRYILEYDAMIHTVDALGEAVEKVGLGNNFRYGEQGVPVKDHGVFQTTMTAGEWNHVAYIVTLPETLDTAAEMRFGIYASPKNAHCYSYYLDNVSLVPYTGDLLDGVVDIEAIEKVEKLKNFDFTAVDGLIYGFDTEVAPFSAGKQYTPEIVDGQLALTVTTDVSNDVQFSLSDVGFAADDYNRLAFKVKCDGEGMEKTYFGLYFSTEEDPTLNQAKCVSLNFSSSLKTDDGYYVGIIELDANEGWKGKIKNLRFDPMQGVYGTIYIDTVAFFKE